MSIFHQNSHATLKYCSNVIYESGYKLGSLRWEIGASLIRKIQKVFQTTVKNQTYIYKNLLASLRSHS